MDPLSLIAGAGLLAVGYLTGRIGRRWKPKEDGVARCGCGHSLALHEPEKATCHATVRQRRARDKKGNYLGNQYVSCTCRQYVGPLPLEQVVDTGIHRSP